MGDSQQQLSPQVIELLGKGDKIGAIKTIRAEQGLGLKEAKDMAESYIQSHPEMVEAYKTSASTGKSGLILLLAAAVGALVWKLAQSR